MTAIPFASALRRHSLSGLVLIGLLAACAGPQLREDVERPEPSHALPPATTGVLAEMAGRIRTANGPEHSGFHLLDGSRDALMWRLALIDSAVSSVDIMTYLWYPDVAGRLILERAVLAAERGVHVRLVIDDLMTLGQEQILADIENHPNIELRLFNPWKKRGTFARGGEMVAEMERLNTRMHDKLLIVTSTTSTCWRSASSQKHRMTCSTRSGTVSGLRRHTISRRSRIRPRPPPAGSE